MESREGIGKEESSGSGYNEDPTGCSNLRWQIRRLHWRTISASGCRPPLKAEISCECPSPSFTSSDFFSVAAHRNTDVFKHRGLGAKKPPAAQATKKNMERRLKVHTAKANSFTGVLDHCWQKYNPLCPTSLETSWVSMHAAAMSSSLSSTSYFTI